MAKTRSHLQHRTIYTDGISAFLTTDGTDEHWSFDPEVDRPDPTEKLLSDFGQDTPIIRTSSAGMDSIETNLDDGH